MHSGNHILKWLCYFDIFSHPLTNQEIYKLCNYSSSSDLQADLDELIANNSIYSQDQFYSIQQEIDKLIQERTKKEQEAKKYFKKLPRYAKLIARFPYVKGIAISGSLSKNIMYEDGDIDYFIITNKERLWVARTFLILYKKVFLLNSRKYFCVNYFVDEDNMRLHDENIFTAVEIAHLSPVYNQHVFDTLKKQNEWTKAHLNNFEPPVTLEQQKSGGLFKKSTEYMLNGSLGEWLDTYFMKMTYKRWQKKFKDFPKEKFDQTMRSNRGVSKHHPRDFQTKVLKEFNLRLAKFGIAE